MHITEIDLEPETDTRTDPGDYPSGAGSRALPAEDYIKDIDGRIIIELEDWEATLLPGEIDEELAVTAQDGMIDTGFNITKWKFNKLDDMHYEGIPLAWE